MARPRKNEDEKLSYKLPDIRVTRAELELIETAAADHLMSKTDYLRMLIFKRVKKNVLKGPQLIIPNHLVAELNRLNGSQRNLYKEFGRSGHFDERKSAEIIALIEHDLVLIQRCCELYIERETAANDR